MKKIILISSMVISMIVCSYSQKSIIELTFTADNNGQHIPLNSILIENITQGGDTTLYEPDTVLVMDYLTGFENKEKIRNDAFSVSQNYPNPIEGSTTVNLYLRERENVVITVCDLIGREFIHHTYKLDCGNHTFTFLPGQENIYFLTVWIDHQCQTIKMFNSSSHAFISGSCRLEYNEVQTGSGGYKAGRMLNNFLFDQGDKLKFTASTVLGERIITCTPTSDQTYYFHYSGDPCPGTPTVTDIDGNTYNTVQIGSQCWMKENLKTTTYNSGILIPNVTDPDEWGNLTTGSYVWYENDISWKDIYGALYNWFATVDTNGLCPTGWHVPTHDEWATLTDFIGGISSPHGNELKSCRQVNSPPGGNCNTTLHPRWDEDTEHYGTDYYGAAMYPSGDRSYTGAFDDLGERSTWWSSTEKPPYERAYYRKLRWNYGSIVVNFNYFQYGFSVRCLRD